MMETTPAASFIVPETNLLLEFLIIPLDAPAQFRQINKVPQDGVLRQGREPVLGRPLLAFRPFDQTPLLRSQGRAPVVAVRRSNADGRKARAQRSLGTFPPGDHVPSASRQIFR